MAKSVFQRYLESRRAPKANPHRGLKRNPPADCKKQSDKYNKYIGAKAQWRGQDVLVENCSTKIFQSKSGRKLGAYYVRAPGARTGEDVPKGRLHMKAWRTAGDAFKYKRTSVGFTGFGQGRERTKTRALEIARLHGYEGKGAAEYAQELLARLEASLSSKAGRVRKPKEKTVKRAAQKSPAAREAGAVVAQTMVDQGASAKAANAAAGVAAAAAADAEKKGLEVNLDKLESAAKTKGKEVKKIEDAAKKLPKAKKQAIEQKAGETAGQAIAGAATPAAALPPPKEESKPAMTPEEEFLALKAKGRAMKIPGRGAMSAQQLREAVGGLPVAANPGRFGNAYARLRARLAAKFGRGGRKGR